MTDKTITSIVTILVGLIGVAIVSVIFSKNAQTPAVIGAAGNAFTSILGTAVSPVTGGGNTSFLNSGLASGFNIGQLQNIAGGF